MNYATRALVLLVSCAALALPAIVAGCHLSAVQAQEALAFEGPACAAAGGAVTLEVPAPGLGGIVAVLCSDVAAWITAAETVAPVVDGGPVDAGPVGAPLPLRRKIVATPGCVPVLVPYDIFKQKACPELHALVLEGSRGVLAAGKYPSRR